MSEAPKHYEVLARKYRPQTFKQVIGQEHVVRTLRNAIDAKRIAHAYLFVGPRGIGKTSTARIFAMALNAPGGPNADFNPEDPVCREIAEGRSLDVREIDGASNNSVEDIRNLREDVRYLPQQGNFKIYIIDEVHMLSTGAFNALLKTLEEPPAHVKFIFATTEVHKVLPTILSRCQRFDLRRIPANLIVEQLTHIAEQEGIQAEATALEALARFADGGMRDAESSFDQLIAFCGRNIKEQDVLDVFGLPPQRAVAELGAHLMQGDAAAAWGLISDLDAQGKDLARVLSDTLSHLRQLLIFQRAPDLVSREATHEQLTALKAQAPLLTPQKLLRLVEFLSETEPKLRYALSPRTLLEVSLASAAEISREVELDDVLAVLGGAPAPAPRPVIVAQPSATAAPAAKPATPVKEPAPAPKPEPVAAPKPEPKPEPAPIAKEEPLILAPVVEKLSPEAAWEEASQLLSPMLRPQFIATFPKPDVIQLEAPTPSLALFRSLKQEAPLRTKIRELLGSSVKLEIVEKVGLAPVQEPAPSEAPAPKPSTSASSATSAAAKPAASNDSAPAPAPLDPEEFLNDPLIKEAVERFGARLASVKAKA